MADFYFLSEDSADFPPPSTILSDYLTVIGSNLKPETIIHAYRKGYFPWYNEGNPRCWFHPNPRMVLFPDELKISRSMRPVLNGNKFSFKIDKHFRQVITLCGSITRWNGETGSWISDEIIEAYTQLHELGYAHCAETWQNNQLVGGLYGLKIGNVFFGESMFSTVSNASKFALIKFVKYLQLQDVGLIDCQQQTQHMASLGARPVNRKLFIRYLEKLIPENENVW